MDDFARLFLNRSVLIYLFGVMVAQVLWQQWRSHRRQQILTRRRTRGLPPENLLYRREGLSERRREAVIETLLLVGSVVVLPFVLVAIGHWLGQPRGLEKSGLALLFVVLSGGLLLSAADACRAFVGGLAFKLMSTFAVPFQPGDRVRLDGIDGKLVAINSFFTVIETLKGEQVSLPTHRLWQERLTATTYQGSPENGLDERDALGRLRHRTQRASQCEVSFYLAPTVTVIQRQATEDFLRESLQSSAYFEPSKPAEIFITQTPTAVRLTVRAYVASTYNEDRFTSDLTRAFLDFAYDQVIPLAAATPALRPSASPDYTFRQGHSRYPAA